MTTLIVKAYAGTGKTTTIVGGLIKSKLTPSPEQAAIWKWMKKHIKLTQKIAVGAFNTSIKEELDKRLAPLIESKVVFNKTIHGHGYALLRQIKGNCRLHNYATDNILEDIIGGKEKLQKFWKTAPGAFGAIKDLVNMTKVNLVDYTNHNDLKLLCEQYDIEIPDKVFGQCIEYASMATHQSIEHFRKTGQISFADMIWLPNILDVTPNAASSYDWFIVDEAQDLNSAQKGIIRRMASNYVFVGDPNQAIYGFAGAECNSMDELQNYPDVTNLQLTLTRRCGKAIVERSRGIVPDFNYHEDNPSGSITSINDLDFMSNLLQESTVGKNDMILCRTNAPLVRMFFNFLRIGRPAAIIGRDIGEKLIRFIKGFETSTSEELITKLEDWHETEMKKLNAKRYVSESQRMAVVDRYSCCMVLAGQYKYTQEILDKLKTMFQDSTDGIRLSSVHKAKGLESHRVHILHPEKMPHPMAKTPEAQKQEINLQYVAWTRAIDNLNFVQTTKKEDEYE